MSLPDSSKGVTFSPEFERDIGDEIDGAGFWIRCLARAIDLIIHYAIYFVTVIIIAIVAGIVAAIIGLSPDLVVERLGPQALTTHALAILASVSYHTFCEGMHGSTLGKLICGLVVVKDNGTHCGILAALGRSFAFYIDGLFFAIPAAISMNDTSKRQRLGDRWAKTMVVKTRDLGGIMDVHSGLRFVMVFFGGMVLEMIIIGLSQILKLVG
jgi:uncharacterized RDD family membrane protein YckC